MTNITDQYRIINTGAGWTDRSHRGRLRFTGADRVSFLQALVSNDLLSLVPGTGVYSTYLTPQGRMIADLRIYHRGDHLIADVAPGLAATLATRLDQLIFAEDLQVVDVTAELAQILVAGGGASARLADLVGLDSAALDVLPVLGQLDTESGFVARTDDAACPTFEVFLPVASSARLLRDLGDAGVVEMTTELVEALRVDAGRPAFGIDMTEETIPLEAGLLERGISTEKGCYVGQEVVIRILHRGGGRVARRLARIRFGGSANDAPEAGAALSIGEREVGRLTSAAASLDGDGWVGLGYVHRDSAEIGRAVTLAGREDGEGEIIGFAG